MFDTIKEGINTTQKPGLDETTAISCLKKALEIGTGNAIKQMSIENAMDGLFYMIGAEEKKIRTNPAARTTDLLRQVFGQ